MQERSNFDKACYELGLNPDVITYNNPKVKRLCDGRELDYCMVALGVYCQQFTVFASSGYAVNAGFTSEYATYRSLVHDKILDVIADYAKDLIWCGAVTCYSNNDNRTVTKTVTLQQCQDNHKFDYLVLDIKMFDAVVKFDSTTLSVEVLRRLMDASPRQAFVDTYVSDFELKTLAEIQVDDFVRFDKSFHGAYLQDAILHLTKAKSISMFDENQEFIHC